MPIYTYDCKKGHEFDKLVSFADAESGKSISCPECKGAGRRRVANFSEVNSSRNKSDGYRVRKRYTNW